jgi:tetratricopeptide (TPR) repeat protein
MMFHADSNPIGLILRVKIRLKLCFLLLSCFLLLQSANAQTSTYAQAEDLVRSHQWDEGLAALAPLLKTDPRNLRALNLAGLASIGKGSPQQADEYFRKALAIDPNFVPALKNLSISEFNSGQFPSSKKHLLSARKLVPDDPAISFYLGEIAYVDKNYPLVIQELGKVPQFVSRKPIAQAHLAISYLLTSETEKATPILDALEPAAIDPKTQFDFAMALNHAGLHDRALSYLAILYDQHQDSYDLAVDLMIEAITVRNFTQAIEAGKRLIASGREAAEVDNLLAQAYEGSGMDQEAFEAYRRAIYLDPKDEENYVDLVSLCMNRGSLQAGMQVIGAALSLHPKSARLVFLRGILHAMQDDLDLAEKDFTLSEQLAPANDLGYIGLGAAYMEGGRSGQAITVLRQRLREKPDDASLLYLLGESLVRAGAAPGSAEYGEAQRAFERATELNPDLCLPHISLGVIYLDQDRYKDAVAQFERARSIDPKERSTYSHLAVAYKRLGERDKAKEVLVVLKGMIDQDHQNANDKMKGSED